MSMKNPLTLAGIEPATFRFLVQHLNHCATAVTIEYIQLINNDRFWKVCVVVAKTFYFQGGRKGLQILYNKALRKKLWRKKE